MNPPAAPRPWSEPDEWGVRTRHATSSRLARLRRADDAPRHVDTLLGAERELVVRLLALGGSGVKGRTLYGKAGNDRHVAVDAAEYVLRHGWAELSEKRDGSRWYIVELRWLDADGLREGLGLPRADVRIAARTEALDRAPSDERLAPLHESLPAMALATLVRRARIVAALDRWCLAHQSGTRAQFAQIELGDTKAMTSSDWQWIEKHIDPEIVGVSRHAPMLWLSGPLCCDIGDRRLDLGCVPDLLGLTLKTVGAIGQVASPPAAWLLVENRTSFEDVARRLGDRFAVLWMPGFVSDGWMDTVRRLVALAPAPAYIAADPDPAGIDIAMRAGAMFEGRWSPWAMSAEALGSIARRKPLNTYDRERLAVHRERELPDELRGLRDALEADGRKGEQEALDLPEWLPALR